jgi:vacuolar-type H+-ATPase subunit E/Vma4
MSIEGIINKISADADAMIAELEMETRKAIEAIEAETENKEKERIAGSEELAETKKKRAFEQTLAREEARLRKEFLAVKQEIVADTFKRARKKIIELSPEKLREMFLGTLESFGEKSGTIVTGSADDAIFDDSFLAEASTCGDFKMERSADFKHGFMLVVGKIQYDARFESLFSEIIEGKTDVVAAKLFPPEGDDT